MLCKYIQQVCSCTREDMVLNTQSSKCSDRQRYTVLCGYVQMVRYTASQPVHTWRFALRKRILAVWHSRQQTQEQHTPFEHTADEVSAPWPDWSPVPSMHTTLHVW